MYCTVVSVFFTLAERASTIPSTSNNIRGCQSGTWLPIRYVVANPIRGCQSGANPGVVANPIRGCQSGTWLPIRYVVTKRSKGHIMVTTHYSDQQGSKWRRKVYATLQMMAPTNNKTVHQTSFTLYRQQPRSSRIVVAYPRQAFSATNRTNTFQPVFLSTIFQVSQGLTSYKNKEIEIPRSMVVEALSW